MVSCDTLSHAGLQLVLSSSFQAADGPLDLTEGTWCLQVLACALLQDLGDAPDGVPCAEVAAFCVDPAFRGGGRGDSLLDYIEQVGTSLSLSLFPHFSRCILSVNAVQLCTRSLDCLSG